MGHIQNVVRAEDQCKAERKQRVDAAHGGTFGRKSVSEGRQ
jgi:hypothetical protein